MHSALIVRLTSWKPGEIYFSLLVSSFHLRPYIKMFILTQPHRVMGLKAFVWGKTPSRISIVAASRFSRAEIPLLRESIHK